MYPTLGRYPVILYLKCYHDTTFKISKYKWQKYLEQNCGCSQDMSLQSLEFSEPNSKYTTRNKKEKSNMNSVTKIQNDTIHIAICLFCFY
jgi:hypothetical protein